jgi:SAM-dependent methyltransferase
MKKPSVGETEFDRYASTYDAAVNKSLAFSGLKVDVFTRMKADYLNALMQSEFPTPPFVNILDVGCGIGNLHPHLSSRAALTGVDVSVDSIDVARENNKNFTYASYDGRTLPFEAATFDLAFTICVLHHVPPAQWQMFVAEMHRVLRPGGLALVFEHNPWNPVTRKIVSSCEFDKDAVLLTATKTEALLSGAGFDAISTNYIALTPLDGTIPRRIERAVSRFPLGAQYYTRGTV